MTPSYAARLIAQLRKSGLQPARVTVSQDSVTVDLQPDAAPLSEMDRAVAVFKAGKPGR